MSSITSKSDTERRLAVIKLIVKILLRFSGIMKSL